MRLSLSRDLEKSAGMVQLAKTCMFGTSKRISRNMSEPWPRRGLGLPELSCLEDTSPVAEVSFVTLLTLSLSPDTCHCHPGTQDAFTKRYASCWDAMTHGGIRANPGEPLQLLMSDSKYKNCTLENLHDNTEVCPTGWLGKADDEFCLKVNTDQVTNDEASRQCLEEGSDLLQVRDATEDSYAQNVITSIKEYALPVWPGYYHMGVYQRRTGEQYYSRNGHRV